MAAREREIGIEGARVRAVQCGYEVVGARW